MRDCPPLEASTVENFGLKRRARAASGRRRQRATDAHADRTAYRLLRHACRSERDVRHACEDPPQGSEGPPCSATRRNAHASPSGTCTWLRVRCSSWKVLEGRHEQAVFPFQRTLARVQRTAHNRRNSAPHRTSTPLRRRISAQTGQRRCQILGPHTTSQNAEIIGACSAALFSTTSPTYVNGEPIPSDGDSSYALDVQSVLKNSSNVEM
jgi:hypothetical protein